MEGSFLIFEAFLPKRAFRGVLRVRQRTPKRFNPHPYQTCSKVGDSARIGSGIPTNSTLGALLAPLFGQSLHAVHAPALDRGYAASGNSSTLACFWNFDFGTGFGTRIRALSASFCVKFWACRKRTFLVRPASTRSIPSHQLDQLCSERASRLIMPMLPHRSSLKLRKAGRIREEMLAWEKTGALGSGTDSVLHRY